MVLKCVSCNWEYPTTRRRYSCKWCGGELDHRRCGSCGEFVHISKLYKRKKGGYSNRCPECNRRDRREWERNNPAKDRAITRRYLEKKRLKVETTYKEWLEIIAGLETKTLSEEEWLDICRFFNGCAICGDPHIETRQFFIPFKDGGKYAYWNIFPMCGECSLKIPIEAENPFKWLDSVLGSHKKLNITNERRQKLIEYFKTQINKEDSKNGE